MTARCLLAAVVCAAGLLAAPAAADASPYSDVVLADKPASYWRMGEQLNWNVLDQAGDVNLGGPWTTSDVWGHPGALAGDPDTSTWMPGVPHGGLDRFWLWHEWTYYNFQGRKPFTLEAWLRPERLNTHTRRVFSAETLPVPGGSDGGYLLGVRADGVVFSRYRNPAGQPARWSTVKAPIAQGRWQHVVGSYDGATMRLYVNGRLAASRPSAIELDIYRVTLNVGSLLGMWKLYAGGLDELALYERALPADRVLAHYRTGAGR